MSDWRSSLVESALVDAGFHPAGQWWANLLDRIAEEAPRVVVVRAGRRAGKTTHAVRWSINEALAKTWKVDPGDQGIISIVSARKWQAEDRIATATKYIQALIPKDKILRANNQRIDFECPWGVCSIRSFTASLGDVVGGTVIAAILDEVARWIDDRGRNPATDVIASLKPSLLSTGGAMWLISSPWSIDDAHAKAFQRGDIGGQIVAHATTWEANSELFTEQDCRDLEPDEIIFDREYGAIPMASDGVHWLPGLSLDLAVGAPVGTPAMVAAGGDLAFMRDSSGLVICHKGDRVGVKWCAEWVPRGEPLSPTHTVGEAMALAKRHGADTIMSDQWARANMIEASRVLGTGYRCRPDNGAHWEYARRAVLEGRISLPHCASGCVCGSLGVCTRLLGQLRRVRVVPDGARLRVEHAREGGAHGDLAEAWACALYQTRGASLSSGIALGSRSRFCGPRKSLD